MTGRYPAVGPGFGPGSVLAGYRLEAKVGEGGMAVVYRARDERLHRPVALKVLAPEFSADEVFRRRFVRESEAAAAVDHPHIIPIYLAGDADGVLFIAMRFVAGGDLRRVMEREGQLAAGRVAEIISPVASALDAAHAAGLVHRDVKPENILVDTGPGRPDHVLLSDFGISKIVTTGRTLTGTGQFIGTLGYSAPEQIAERPVDGRADQYALACVSYELLTGTALFQRETNYGVLMAHAHERPPLLTTRRPDLPFAADEVMARALAKSPGERYLSCADFADALREACRLPPYHVRRADLRPAPDQPPATPSEPSRTERPSTAGRTGGMTRIRRPAMLRVAAGVLAIAGGTVGLMSTHGTSAPPRALGSVASPGALRSVAPPGAAGPVPPPVSLVIPEIGVSANVISIGLASNGSLNTGPLSGQPQALDDVGWYTGSVRPGAIGPAVIAGDNIWAPGEGAFANLNEVHQGDFIYVTRANGSTVEFRVTKVQESLKTDFPTDAVFGPTPDAELRLITDGGTFDAATAHYLSNVIVYATEV